MLVSIARTDLVAVALRGAAARRQHAQAARRLLALDLVAEGIDRTMAAATCGMDRRTLRDRAHRGNADGLAGLLSRKAPARSRSLDADRVADLAGLGGDGSRSGAGRGRALAAQGRGRALAAQGPSAADRGKVRGGVARAHCGQVSGNARLSSSVCAPAAPAAPEVRSRGAGPFQEEFRSPGGRPGKTA